MRVFREVAWLKHLGLGDESTLFPRNIGLSSSPGKIYQKSVKDDYQYLTELMANWSRHDCFTAASSDYQIKNKIVDRIFLEFDESDESEMARKGKEVYACLKDKGVVPYVLYSGNRSYHYHLFFDPIRLESPGRKIRQWVKGLGLDFLDYSVVGDVRRLVKMPYTVHSATGRFCVPIPNEAFEMSETDLLMLTGRLSRGEEFVPMPQANNLSLLESLAKIKIEKKAVRVGAAIDTSSYPPCIVAIIERIDKTKHAKHEPRFHLAAFMNRLRKPIEETRDMFSVCSDFSELTMYHLRRIYGKDMRCFNCEKAKVKGLCPLGDSTCPWYPSPNLYL